MFLPTQHYYGQFWQFILFLYKLLSDNHCNLIFENDPNYKFLISVSQNRTLYGLNTETIQCLIYIIVAYQN